MSRGKLTPTLSVGGFLEEIAADEVKRSVDLVSLFAEFGVSLTQKGKSHMGNCPWHEDSTPSLSVDREKGLYNCFGCGESGDAISLVRKMKGYEFVQAVSWLKQQNGRYVSVEGPARQIDRPQALPQEKSDPVEPVAPKPERPASQSTKNKEEPTSTPSQLSSISLNDLVAHWTGVLETNTKAQVYLENRGLTDRRIWNRFRIGFSDGSLSGKLSETQIQAAKDQGIITKAGKETFAGFIIVPLIDEHDKVVSLYGRAITGTTEPAHRYLSGPRTGWVNGKVVSVYPDRLILPESIIDALSLVQAGIENVIPAYGTGGVSDEMIAHFADQRVKEVVIAFDADEAGRTATEKLTGRLTAAGFGVRNIVPEGGKDWNELLLAGALSAEGIKNQIQVAELCEPERGLETISITQEGVKHLITIAERQYTALGVKQLFSSSLRINLRLETPAGRYLDNVDLYSARSRSGFAAGAAGVTGIDAKRIEKDLLLIVENLERQRDAAFTDESEGPKELTEDERETGLALLQDPNLFDRIKNDLDTAGYVGEDINKLLMYVAASSRKLDDPLSVMVISDSASGKSRLIDTVAALMPAEDVISMTSLSDQALNYLSEDALVHKFLVMGEAMHSHIIELQIREMLSAKQLSRLVTVKDPKTGQMASRIVRKEVLVSVALSSTDYSINPENASRFFVVNADESAEQTRRIHEAQRKKYSLTRIRDKQEKIPAIIRAHHAAQRLLKPYRIINRFADFLSFPTGLMRTRRDHERFLDLIACVAHLRQYQKEIKETRIPGHDEPVAYLECDLKDYEIAYRIMVGVLPATLSSFPRGAAHLYETLRTVARQKGEQQRLSCEEVTLTQREIREAGGLHQRWVKRYMKVLVDYEYVLVSGMRKSGSRYGYRLVADSDLSAIDLSMIPHPQSIASKLQSLQSGPGGPDRSYGEGGPVFE